MGLDGAGRGFVWVAAGAQGLVAVAALALRSVFGLGRQGLGLGAQASGPELDGSWCGHASFEMAHLHLDRERNRRGKWQRKGQICDIYGHISNGLPMEYSSVIYRKIGSIDKEQEKLQQ